MTAETHYHYGSWPLSASTRAPLKLRPLPQVSRMKRSASLHQAANASSRKRQCCKHPSRQLSCPQAALKQSLLTFRFVYKKGMCCGPARSLLPCWQACHCESNFSTLREQHLHRADRCSLAGLPTEVSPCLSRNLGICKTSLHAD